MPETPLRRSKLFRPEASTIGVDIGGTKILAGVVDPYGRVLARRQVPTPGYDVQLVEDSVVSVVRDLGKSHEIAAVGIGAAGFVDAARRTVMFSPHLNWRREPLQSAIAERVRLPVVVDNDANAAGVAECLYGAARGHRFVLCITLGTGIGGALIIDRKVFRGDNGMAGEFGHMQVVPNGHRCECGNRGCWEQYASGTALLRDARELIANGSPLAHRLRELVDGDPTRLTGPQVTQEARSGDPLSLELLSDIGDWLGVGLAGLAAAFDPSCIVVGGGLSDAGDLLLDPTRSAFSKSLTGRGHRSEPVIVVAELGPEAGFIGAADMARSAARKARRGTRRADRRAARSRVSAVPSGSRRSLM